MRFSESETLRRAKTVAISLAAVGTMVISSSLPAETPVDILKKATQAPLHVSYRAVETMMLSSGRNRNVQRTIVVHRAPDRTKWSYMDGKIVSRVVSDNRGSHWQYIPRLRELIFSPSLPADRPVWEQNDFQQLISNYRVGKVGAESVSGRKCVILSVTPVPGHIGPSKRVWVDTVTGLIVKSESMTSDGRTRAIDVLSELKFEKNVSISEFTPPTNVSKQSVIYGQAATLPLRSLARQWKHPLLVPRAPKGYSLESARLVHRGKFSFVHLMYDDGRTSISLFEEPSTNAGPAVKGDRVHGSVVEWRMEPPFIALSWRERGVKLTLVGDMPRGVMLAVANSAKPFAK